MRMRTMVERTAYADEIARLYDQPEEREARMDSIGEFANAISAYEDNAKKPDLDRFPLRHRFVRSRDGQRERQTRGDKTRFGC